MWQKGSKEGLSFTSNAAIVTLKTSYLETLSAGKHTLGIVSDTGTAVTEFTIKAASAFKGINSLHRLETAEILLSGSS